MIEITKGRYGYKAEDGTIKIAPPGKKLSLEKDEEERLVKRGNAVYVEEEVKVEAKVDAPAEPVSEPAPKPRKRKGRKA
ncbi:MAG: hypothetical protein K6G60_08390 [Lachnospiraceae bacterium]|nr:hypothetical protein [Lachnospiraceae bacterium]